MDGVVALVGTEQEQSLPYYRVRFLSENGTRLVKGFRSLENAIAFSRRVRHSNKTTLLSTSGFIYR